MWKRKRGRKGRRKGRRVESNLRNEEGLAQAYHRPEAEPPSAKKGLDLRRGMVN